MYAHILCLYYIILLMKIYESNVSIVCLILMLHVLTRANNETQNTVYCS